MNWIDQPRDVCGRFMPRRVVDERVTTLSGEPPTVDNEAAPGPIDEVTGMHTDYYVLKEEERAKGFMRPVRQSYTHGKCGKDTMMAIALAESFARDPNFYGKTFCTTCGNHRPISEFVWKGTEEEVGS